MIYCVEDDSGIRELVVYTLHATGFDAAGFANGDALFEALAPGKAKAAGAPGQAGLPDLILLDIMLPGEDGIQILKRIRAAKDTKDIPVIMLTAKGAEFDKVSGLDSGADDYIAKPFGMMELVSRIKAVLRRSGQKKEPAEINAGSIVLNMEEHRVLVDGRETALTPKEFYLLNFLMENRGLVFSREKLLSEIWGFEYYGETRTVDVHIRSLRLKLGAAAEMIETVRGVGYRIVRK
ncbi:MAG: winged helix-turn-helix domain-containing protein [Flexilinea sp.]